MSACCSNYPNCEHNEGAMKLVNDLIDMEPQTTNGVLSVSSLQWKPTEAPDSAPELMCDECHKMHPAKGQLSADVKVNNYHTFSIVVCSDRCLYLFKRRKNIDGILRQTVNTIRKKMRMEAIKNMGNGNRA